LKPECCGAKFVQQKVPMEREPVIIEDDNDDDDDINKV
jgi:hypothetical protein